MPQATQTWVRPRMGTLLALSLPVSDQELEADFIRTTFDTAAACEAVMSAHRPDTDLARLNRVAGDGSGLVSPDLANALRLARELAERTGGAFDPTIGPVLSLWQSASQRGVRPTAGRLRQAISAVDWRSVRVAGARVALERSGMRVDLGGFGKGATLDRISSRLRRDGCESALLNFGESSLMALGRRRNGGWRVVLRHPLGGFAAEFPLGNRACSTSATFGRPVGAGAVRVSSVIHPRTGRPLTGVAQVTVLARTAAVAEAVSTAMLVEGRAAMEELARRLDVDACWIDRAGIHATRSFPLRRLG